MRLTKEKTEQNRRHILEIASRMFKLQGIENVGVADIMKEAGFTHGGFYNHFGSKVELAAEATASAFDVAANYLAQKVASQRDAEKALASALAEYLSPMHRDSSTGGCPASALPIDAARNGRDVQTSFAKGIEAYLDILAAKMDGDKKEARQKAIALLTRMVGALMLSRAVKKSQPKLSEELLRSAQKNFPS